MNNLRLRERHLSLDIAVLCACLAPRIALGEEEVNTGMRLLKPNMAEFIPACVAFIIIFLLLSKFAWPMVLRTMDDREKKISDDFAAAEKARQDAESVEAELSQRRETAEREAQQIVAEAKKLAENERSRIIAEGQSSAQKLITKARESVSDEREKAMIELSGQVVDLSVEIATKIIGDSLSTKQQRELAERYLTEVGSLNDD